MMKSPWKCLAQDPHSKARRGVLTTRHGDVQTPIFMPVGTQATVKGALPSQVRETGAQIILGNTYHLNLRPGSELIRDMGGLHSFMGWDHPILTDSGGFQVFSLSALRKITPEGIRFKSHLDGREIVLTPERVIDIQMNLGSDIAMVLDECPPADASEEDIGLAVDRSLVWAKQAREYKQTQQFLDDGHLVFGIAQGGRFDHLRIRCARELAAMDFPGYAIGGVSVGEPEEAMIPQVAVTAEQLPEEKSRYVMGVGTPPQLLKMIACGADMFDCVMPSREARHGIAYTAQGRLNLKNAQYKKVDRPLMEELSHPASTQFSRAYIRHLMSSGEMLGGILLTLHNLHFYLDLMRQAREHIETGDFLPWSKDWIDRYQSK